ncbi:MAG: hypothetical protein QXG81_07930 [Ignisphaera sp.]
MEKVQNGLLLEIRFKFTPLFSKPMDMSWSPISPYGSYWLDHTAKY